MMILSRLDPQGIFQCDLSLAMFGLGLNTCLGLGLVCLGLVFILSVLLTSLAASTLQDCSNMGILTRKSLFLP